MKEDLYRTETYSYDRKTGNLVEKRTELLNGKIPVKISRYKFYPKGNYFLITHFDEDEVKMDFYDKQYYSKEGIPIKLESYDGSGQLKVLMERELLKDQNLLKREYFKNMAQSQQNSGIRKNFEYELDGKGNPTYIKEYENGNLITKSAYEYFYR